MEKIELKKQPIYVIGDIHSHFDILFEFILKNNFNNCTIFIAGDIGIGFNEKKYYEKIFTPFNKALSNINVNVFFIRGNHDDPSFFIKDPFGFSNIKLIKDYTVVSIGNENILCIGGAISIDRKHRISKLMCARALATLSNKDGIKSLEEIDKLIPHSYWENEIPYFDNDLLTEINNNVNNIDYVITHTSPSFCFKIGKDGIKSWLDNDKNLENDLKKERETIDNIYNVIVEKNNIKKWIYGHFHEHHNEKINNIEFIALDMIRNDNVDCIEINHI